MPAPHPTTPAPATPTANTSRVRRAAHTVVEVITAASMVIGRGRAARIVADLAQLTPHDRVIDLGCGPGTAVREAARRGATATGIDPAPIMLALARWLSAARSTPTPVTFLHGSAERIPLPDRTASVVWALSSAHHWDDLPTAIGEICRVLTPGGRVVIAEPRTAPGAHGHAAHGLTDRQVGLIAEQLTAAGLSRIERHTRHMGHRTLTVLTARRG